MVDVAIIGGGIAGCMAAYTFRQAGADVLLIERHAEVASEASGNPYGLVMPQLSVGKSKASEFNGQAYQAAIEFYSTLNIEKHAGVLQCAVNDDEELRFNKLSDQQNWDSGFCAKLDAAQASDVLGIKFSRSALWFPKALTVSPKQICQFLSQDVSKKLSTEVLDLQFQDNLWKVRDGTGNPVASTKKIVIANAMDALRFPQTSHLPLRPRRGQLTFVPADQQSRQIKTSFTFGGYMTRALNGLHVLGATYEVPLENPSELTEKEHRKNLAKLHQIFPALFTNIDSQALSGRAAVRTTTPDHLPIVGAIPGYSDLYVLTGLGSRGLTTAFFAAGQLL